MINILHLVLAKSKKQTNETCQKAASETDITVTKQNDNNDSLLSSPNDNNDSLLNIAQSINETKDLSKRIVPITLQFFSVGAAMSSCPID